MSQLSLFRDPAEPVWPPVPDMLRWLPAAEAEDLRDAFEAALERLAPAQG